MRAASSLEVSGERCVKWGGALSLPQRVVKHHACGKSGEESSYVVDGGARVECGPLARESALGRAVLSTQLYFQLCRSTVNSPSHGVSPERSFGPGGIPGFGVEEQDPWLDRVPGAGKHQDLPRTVTMKNLRVSPRGDVQFEQPTMDLELGVFLGLSL